MHPGNGLLAEARVPGKKGILQINKEDIPLVKGRVPAALSCYRVVSEREYSNPATTVRGDSSS